MVQPWSKRLRGESEIVEVVTEEAEGEDGNGEEVASCIWGAEDSGQPVRFVL